MDAAGYLATVDTAVASNTKLEKSALGVGEAAQVSAKNQVTASLRATEAIKTQIAEQRALAASATETAAVRERAALLANRAEARLNSQLGLAATLAGTSKAAQTSERDIGKFTRGALAGSGAAVGLGRSLAFASGGFLAVASGATLIKDSIQGAERLATAQDSLSVAIEKTGGNVAKLGPRYAATAKNAQQFGIDQADATTELARATVLTGDAGKAQRAYAEALVISKATGKDFNAVLTATAKGQEGVTTSLKRYGILIATGTPGQKQYQDVFARFAGQAKANTTQGEKFSAALHNTEAIIGTGLLPTFTRLTTELTDWLTKMSRTGRLQRDVNEAVTVGGHVFHALGAAIGFVDKVTGSFGNTLKIVLGGFLLREASKALLAVDRLAASWTGVTAAATTAAAAEERATAVGGAGLAAGGAGAAGAAGSGIRGFFSLRGGTLPGQPLARGSVATRVGQYTGAAGAGSTGILAGLGAGAAAFFGTSQDAFPTTAKVVTHKDGSRWVEYISNGVVFFTRPIPSIGPPIITPGVRAGNFVSPFSPALPGVPGAFGESRATSQRSTGPFGAATPIAVYSKYAQTITEQLSVAQAALTKTTTDDVAAAKAIIARIRRLIAGGHLQGAALVQALQDEATQQGVLDSARATAAVQAAKIAAAKKAAASSYTTPIDLQLSEARAQLTKTSSDDIAVEKRILAAAKAAVASGSKNKQGQLAALQVELQAQQALAGLQTQNATNYTLPARLSLALAKEQALGTDQTKTLLAMKAALEKALKASKGNIQKQIDIYNQITSINQQLGQSVNSIFGDFKVQSTQRLTSGLGLTPAQRAALRARLSQRGPGGTVPARGVGAAGYEINPDTGRPIVLHANLYVDGKKMAENTTKHQQRRRSRNSSQRRGPVAGG
jgi:hypothetical protein